MGVAGGIFNIIQRGQIYSAPPPPRPAAINAADAKSNDTKSSSGTDPLNWSMKPNESAVEAFWRLAPDEAKRSNAATLDTAQRLQKAADGNNSDIAAEKLRQAKAKLDGLRRQLQMLAATGDVRQLRRIAAEAASLAREIGSAARSMAQGIGAGSISTDASAAQATATAATNAAQTASPDAPAQPSASAQTNGPAQTASGMSAAAISAGSNSPLDQSFKALHELGNEARNAVVQAKGIISLAAQIARSRSKRGSDDEDERYFRNLQEQADAALDDIDTGQREALSELVAAPGEDAGSDISGGVLTTTTLEVTVTTMVFAQTSVEVYA